MSEVVDLTTSFKDMSSNLSGFMDGMNAHISTIANALSTTQQHEQAIMDDDFGGDFTDNHANNLSGIKRSFGELDDDEDDIFGSKKVNSKPEETASGAATGMILALRESLDKSKDDLAQCEMELEAAKSEIQKWHSSFLNDSFIPAGTNPEPKIVVEDVRTLRSSEKCLKEQLEKAKKKESAFIVTFAKREQEIAELKRRLKSTAHGNVGGEVGNRAAVVNFGDAGSGVVGYLVGNGLVFGALGGEV
ncbi:hypothetical protein KSS87_022565 [Heliosperma pusillum]|nr:hypothetical protein KSS87_022565 [Heliosperma pusillum]